MVRNSIADYFAEFKFRGREIAIVERRGLRSVTCTYGDLAQRAQSWAGELAALNIGKGDRVLLWGENSAAWIAAFQGCQLRGAIVVPMDEGASPDFVRRVAGQSGARIAIISPDIPSLGGTNPASLPPFLPVLSLDHDITSRFSPPIPLVRDDVAEIIFTSGSTAEPKGVVLTHGNLLATLESLERQIRPYLKYERPFHPLRFMVVLPLSHVFGQLLGILIPPLLGAAVVFPGTLRVPAILQAIHREHATVLIAVPHILDSLREAVVSEKRGAGAFEQFDRKFAQIEKASFLRRCWAFRDIHQEFGWKFWAVISGGAALSQATETFWTRLGFAVIQGYGLTETASLISVNHPFRSKRGSIGKALPGLDVRLGPGGEIQVRGPNVAAGYWGENKPKKTADRKGWFNTGDIGEADAAGNLYFRGRSKNVIVTPAGLKIYPEDLESALRAQQSIRDCAVVGIEHGGNFEPCAALLLWNVHADAAAAVHAANASLSDFQQIRRWFVWPEVDFPRTATQKPILPEIQSNAQARFGIPGKEERGDNPPGWLARFLREKTGGRDFSSLSSLDRVELVSELERRFNISLDEASVGRAETLAEVERTIRESPLPQPSAAFPFPRWTRASPVRMLREMAYWLLVDPAVHFFAWPRVRGRENLHGLRSPVLIISNHVADFDSGWIVATLPSSLRRRLAIAMGGERLRDYRWPPSGASLVHRWLARVQYFLLGVVFNVFSLPKRGGFSESFSYMGELADAGWSTLVFPEGEVTPDGQIHSFRRGIGLLASQLSVPVIPARIGGVFALRQRGRHFARPGAVSVTYGKPIVFPAGAPQSEIINTLEQIMRSL